MIPKVTAGAKIGQSPARSAGAWNQIADAVNSYQATRDGKVTETPTKATWETDLVKVQNLTGSNRLRGEVVQLGTFLLGTSPVGTLYARNPWFQGNTVAAPADSKIAILKRPSKAAVGDTPADITLAQMSGVCSAWVNVSDVTHKFATAVVGSYQLASAAAGPITILTPLTTTGAQEVFVLLSGVTTPMRFYNADTVSAPPHAVMQIVGDTVIGGVVYLNCLRPQNHMTSANLPDPDSIRAEYVLNLCGTVAAGGTGTCEFASSSADFPTLAAYEPTDPSPVVGDSWGPWVGSWTLRYGLPGFKVLGIGTDTTDQGGCLAPGSGGSVLRVIASHEDTVASWQFYALNGTDETTVPAFAALSPGAYGGTGGTALQTWAQSTGFFASGAGQGSSGTDPCCAAWSLINGPPQPTGATGSLGRTGGDGFSRPLPVLVTGNTSFQPRFGQSCGPIPTTSASDANRFCFGAGLPGWRCVSSIYTVGTAPYAKYYCYVVRDHLTRSWPAVATSNWYGSSGSTSQGYVSVNACTGGITTADTSGGSVYNGAGGSPTVAFHVLLPTSNGYQDPNVIVGNYLEYSIGSGFMQNPPTGTVRFCGNRFFWVSTGSGTDHGVATIATPYLDDKVGTIKMAWATPATIPQGWNLADGTNGSQDLRGRFIVGAGNVGGNGANFQLSGSAGAQPGQLVEVVDSTSHNCTLTKTTGSALETSQQFYATPPAETLFFIQRLK